MIRALKTWSAGLAVIVALASLAPLPTRAQQVTTPTNPGCTAGQPCAASSVAIGGATIGSDALAVTGTATISSYLAANHVRVNGLRDSSGTTRIDISGGGVVAIPSGQQLSVNAAGAASAPPATLTGTWFSGGSATTTKPQFLIEPTGTTSTAWSTSGTGLGINAASGFGGSLAEWFVAGASKHQFLFNGDYVMQGSFTQQGSSSVFNGGTSRADTAGFAVRSTGGFNFSSTSGGGGAPDASFHRVSAGLIGVDNGTSGSYRDLILRSVVAGGSAPTLTGTCTTSTQVGGNTAGSFAATCTAQTVIITFATTAPNGWVCNAQDETTSADTMKQTAHSTTSCTFTGTTVAADVIVFDARAY